MRKFMIERLLEILSESFHKLFEENKNHILRYFLFEVSKFKVVRPVRGYHCSIQARCL